jgi:TonB family protein
VVTAADVTSALVADAGGGHFSVNVSFSAAGSNRLAESTKIHIGRPVAIVLNGRVIAAPVLRSQIRDSAVISGDFTKEQADRIAAGLGAKPAAAAAPGAQRYKGDDPGVVLPVAQFKPRPEYTPAAMEAKIQGVVELSAVVRTDGTTSDVTVVQSLDTAYGLDDSAVAAVSQWTFTPGTKDGTPVDVEVHIMIRFTLT